ncbi:hypothetical protein RDV84_10635 [Lysobacter yananisis]|uniref:Uncharacterized protein n=1 Tax=Lysobacter yananisis TaxID=1003114 RepID=A0ABY9PFW1_9GAMM|nr:hypothetical protein [Lysobacter yananisis]WMT05274.1 hypothetical protein RDV84_10635 [Lysobacter yananisis]
MDFIGFVNGIPAPLWGLAGTVVGVFGTLGANFLSNRSNDKRFVRQLAHDATQKAKDRAMQLRREVYLTAVDEVVAVGELLGRLAVLDPTDSVALTSKFNSFARACSRVQLVASERSRFKIAELSGAYAGIFLELMGEASVAHKLKMEIDINREKYGDLQSERTRLIAAMRDVGELKDSKHHLGSLLRSFDSTTSPLEIVATEYLILSDKHNNALTAYGAMVGVKMAEVMGLQAEVTALLRSEFDLDVDLDSIKRQAEEQRQRVLQASEAFLRRVKE